MEGRDTPSRGLDLAAEYIAAQFRRARLEPVGDDGYFQTADMLEIEPAKSGFAMNVKQGARSIRIARREVATEFRLPLTISGGPVFKLPSDEQALTALKPENVTGKVVMTELPSEGGGEARRRLYGVLQRVKPKLTVLLAARAPSDSGPKLVAPDLRSTSQPPRLVVHNPELLKWFKSLPPGPTAAALTLRLPALVETPVKLRNVIGLLRGSDPVLKETYILVTAHYDHLGMKPDGTGDRIYNGANDDGSGTVSVIELASALASLEPRPKRSIVFMTFFGEEEGGLGSLYYARHPIFPIAQTIADVNLEQVGRTDSTDGPKIAEGTFTGFPYSDLPKTFQAAGEQTGVHVLSDERYGSSFFVRSDNISLAKLGIPSHTLAVAFEFADYHAVSDEWHKIDYENMAKVDRMLALGLIMLAQNPEPPKWNEANPAATPYVKAWKEHHAPKP